MDEVYGIQQHTNAPGRLILTGTMEFIVLFALRIQTGCELKRSETPPHGHVAHAIAEAQVPRLWSLLDTVNYLKPQLDHKRREFPLRERVVAAVVRRVS